MANAINAVVLSGNLGADPELRSTKDGTAVCDLRLAVNGSEKRGGEWVDTVTWVTVTVWGATAENCDRYLSKGKPVAVSGRLQEDTWEDREGNKRSKLKVVAQRVQFLGGRDDDGAEPEPARESAGASESY